MSRFRLAARLARREIRRHPWRTALAVVIMVLPVMAGQGFVLAAGADHAADQVAGRVPLEGADLRTAPGEVEKLVAKGMMPEPVRMQRTFTFYDWLVDRSGGLEEVVAIGSVKDSPRAQLEHGRLPRDDHEVLANARALDASGKAIGDRIELAHGDVKLRIVGETVIRDLTDRPGIVVGPSSERSGWLAKVLSSPAASPNDAVVELSWFAPGVDGAAAYASAFGGDDAAAVGGTTANTVAAIAALVGGAIGIIAVICSVAFTIGSRRRLRSLGLLASSGAAPADLGWMVVLEGLWCGALAAVVATGATYAWWTTLGSRIVVEPLIGHSLAAPPMPLLPAAMAAIALVCLVIGPLAAAVPARTAARTPVLTALGGRRPLPPVRARIPLAGLIAFGMGTAVITRSVVETGKGHQPNNLVQAVAGLAVVFGGVAMAPTIVAVLGRLGRRARGSMKLALRSVSRDRTRNAAVVGAAAVTLALPVIAMTQLAHDSHRRDLTRPTYGQVRVNGTPADLPGAVRRIEHILGGGTVAVHVVVAPNPKSPPTTGGEASAVAVISPEDVETWFGGSNIAALLDRGEAVDPHLVGSGAVGPRNVTMPDIDGLYHHDVRPRVRPVEVTVDDLVNDPHLEPLVELSRSGGVLVRSDALAEGAVARLQRSAVVLRKRPITATENKALNALAVASPTLAQVRAAVANGNDEGRSMRAWLERLQMDVSSNRPGPDHTSAWMFGTVGVATVLSLAIVLVALALATADGRDDERLFAALGGAPWLLRRKRTIEAAVLTFGAGVLGVGIGLIPTLAMLWAARPMAGHVFPPHPAGYEDIPVPVADLALLVVGVTVVVAVVVWVVQAAGGLRPRRDLVVTDG